MAPQVTQQVTPQDKKSSVTLRLEMEAMFYRLNPDIKPPNPFVVRAKWMTDNKYYKRPRIAKPD
jgi:hypothetical protein